MFRRKVGLPQYEKAFSIAQKTRKNYKKSFLIQTVWIGFFLSAVFLVKLKIF